VIHPRRKDAHGAQLATMLVRHHIVWIVGHCPVVSERAENRAADCFARNDTVTAIVLARGPCEKVVEVGLRHPTSSSGALADLRFGQIDHVAGERDDVVLGYVVAERVKDFGRDDFGAGPELGIFGLVHLDEVQLACRVSDSESGSRSGGVTNEEAPASRCRTIRLIRPTTQLVEGQRLGPDPVGEPARVGDLVDRVDVAGSLIVPFARLQERVFDKIEPLTRRSRCDLGCVSGFRKDGQRIVRIERGLRRVAGDCQNSHEGRCNESNSS
jgi:hypothetical protein